MTASMRLVHEGCGSGHFTVGGAGNGLRKALAIASDGVHRRQSRALSEASRAGVSLQTQGKCGSGQLGPATDGPGPGGRQRRRGGGLGAGNSASWHLLLDKVTRGVAAGHDGIAAVTSTLRNIRLGFAQDAAATRVQRAMRAFLLRKGTIIITIASSPRSRLLRAASTFALL